MSRWKERIEGLYNSGEYSKWFLAVLVKFFLIEGPPALVISTGVRLLTAALPTALPSSELNTLTGLSFITVLALLWDSFIEKREDDRR